MPPPQLWSNTTVLHFFGPFPKGSKKNGFSPTSPERAPPAPTNVDYFFTVPIMAYIMRSGNMNGGLSKSFKKMGTLDFSSNPPFWI